MSKLGLRRGVRRTAIAIAKNVPMAIGCRAKICHQIPIPHPFPNDLMNHQRIALAR